MPRSSKPSPAHPRWATVAEVARYCGCSVAKVRYMISRGELPAGRFGVEIRIDLNRVDALIDGNPVTGPDPRRPGRPSKKTKRAQRRGSAARRAK